MTRKHPSLWPTVALTAIAALFCLGLFVIIPDDEPQMRMALLGVVVLAGNGVVARFVTGHVSRETRRMANVSRETSTRGRRRRRKPRGRGRPDVSRETSTTPRRKP